MSSVSCLTAKTNDEENLIALEIIKSESNPLVVSRKSNPHKSSLSLALPDTE